MGQGPRNPTCSVMEVGKHLHGRRGNKGERAQSVKECLGSGQCLEEEKIEGRNQVIVRPKWINFYGKRPKYIMF